jgi:hypothetical protein
VETHENPQAILCAGRDSNRVLLGCKSSALPLDQTIRSCNTHENRGVAVTKTNVFYLSIHMFRLR